MEGDTKYLEDETGALIPTPEDFSVGSQARLTVEGGIRGGLRRQSCDSETSGC